MPVQIENTANVRMRDSAGELDLPLESRQRILISDAHSLHRDARYQVEIFGLVHFPHTSRADRPHDAISSGEDLAGVERPGQHGWPHPFTAEQTDVEQSVRMLAVPQHRHC